MPNKYSYSHVIADLGRRGIFDPTPKDVTTQDDAFKISFHEDVDESHTLPPYSDAQEMRSSQSSLSDASPSYFYSPSSPPSPPVRSTSRQSGLFGRPFYSEEGFPSTSINENVEYGNPDEVESVRSSLSLQTVVHDPISQMQIPFTEQHSPAVSEYRRDLSIKSPSRSLNSLDASPVTSRLQETVSSYSWPEPHLSGSSENESSTRRSSSTQPSTAQSPDSSRPPSGGIELAPFVVHDQQPRSPSFYRHGERKHDDGRKVLPTVDEDHISTFPVPIQSQSKSAKGKGILKTSRSTDFDLFRSHEIERPRSVQSRRNWEAWNDLPSDAQISRVLRSTRLPPQPDEPKDVRRLGGVEMVEGTRLATQNTDGTEIPVVEAAAVNDLPTPPEAVYGPGLMASGSDPENGSRWEPPADRLRAASPPPPPNYNRDEVRRIGPRATNQGRSIAQEHFTGFVKSPSTRIKDHIDSIASQFEQKLFGGRRSHESKEFEFSPEADSKAASENPGSATMESSIEQYWAQSDDWDERPPVREHSRSLDLIAAQSFSEEEPPIGEPHIERAQSADLDFGFDEEHLTDPSFEGDISSSRFEQILGLEPRYRQEAPSSLENKDVGRLLRRIVPGQHDNGPQYLSESHGSHFPRLLRGEPPPSADRYSSASESSGGDALPPAIRR